MTTTRRAVVALLLAGLAALVTATPALAHTKLDSSNPAQGAALNFPPKFVSLTFDDPVTLPPNAIQVTGPGGVQWAVGTVTVTDATVTAPVTATGPAGAYTLHYTVIADDGDSQRGTVAFTLTVAPTTTAPPTPTPIPTPTPVPVTTAPRAAAPPQAPIDSVFSFWVWAGAALVLAAVIVAAVAWTRRRTDH